MAAPKVVLLNNVGASQTGSDFEWRGGLGKFIVEGTPGTAVALFIKTDAGAYVPMCQAYGSTAIVMTVAGSADFIAPHCIIRATTVLGAAAVTATAIGIEG